MKGDTVSNVTKPATLETGAVVQVPLFVNLGDRIKVDPREAPLHLARLTHDRHDSGQRAGRSSALDARDARTLRSASHRGGVEVRRGDLVVSRLRHG